MKSKKFWKKYLKEDEDNKNKNNTNSTKITAIDKFQIIKSISCIVLMFVSVSIFLVGYSRAEKLWELQSIIPLIAIVIIEFIYAKPVMIFVLSFIDDDWGIFIVPLAIFVLTPVVLVALVIINIYKIIREIKGTIIDENYEKNIVPEGYKRDSEYDDIFKD